MRVAQIDSVSNQMEYDVMYQSCLTSSFFPRTCYLSRNNIYRNLTTYICLDIYLGIVVVEAFELQSCQQVMLMTFFIIEIVARILLAN